MVQAFQLIGNENRVNTTTANVQSLPAAAGLSGGGYVIVWQDGPSASSDVRAQLYDASGAKAGAEFVVDGTANAQGQPRVVALASGGFVVSWSDNSANAADYDIRAQRYDASGAPVGGAFTVNSVTGGTQISSSLTALPGGGFVATWRSGTGNADTFDVKGQVFDANGMKVGGEFLASASPTFAQNDPTITTLPSGRFVISWTTDIGSSNGLPGPANVRAQIFEANGVKVGGEISVNAATVDSQALPSITALASGGFVVTWQQINGATGDANDYDIRGQIFDSSGVKVGAEFGVNTPAITRQDLAKVVGLPTGGFLVSWSDAAGDGSGYGVKAQLFDADGSKRGDAFLLNTTTSGDQVQQTLAVLASGRLISGWADNSGLGGDADRSIKAQLLALYPSDVISGGAAADTLNGTGGNDLIDGGAGNDMIAASTGDDIVSGGLGADRLDGGVGSDIADYSGNFGAIRVDLAAGTGRFNFAEGDVLIGIEGVFGTEFNDLLFGDAAANQLVGNGGADLLSGGAGDDRLSGGAGDDLLLGGLGADLLDGGDGVDTVDYSGNFGGVSVDLATGVGRFNYAEGDQLLNIENVVGTSFNDILIGNSSANRLEGGNGNDTLSGSAGNDVLLGGLGADALDGGTGVDTADYSGNFGAISVSLATGVGRFNYAEGDSLSGIENVIGTEFGDVLVGDAQANHLVGNGGIDILNGGDGDDNLSGGAGDDLLVGGLGADLLDGGTGVDIADYSGNFGGVSVNLETGVGRFNYAEGDQLVGIENVIGTDFGDILTGNASANRLEGGLGNDSLSGGGGNDLLLGGQGADVFDGGAGVDTVDYTGNFGAVSINLATGVGRFNYAEGDRFSGVENVVGTEFGDILTGDGGANDLSGNGGADLLSGGAGADRLFGGAGDDTLSGGLGADVLDGGAGVDTADYSGNFGGVSINLATGTGRFNYAEGDSLSGIENVVGTDFGDIFEGNGAANMFRGGGGNDMFIFRAGWGQDRIADFTGNGANAGDSIRFASGTFANFADVMAHAQQSGSDVVIALDATNTLTLMNTQLAALDSSDFVFG